MQQKQRKFAAIAGQSGANRALTCANTADLARFWRPPAGAGGTVSVPSALDFNGEWPEPVMEYKTWMCLICGWIYDEAAGAPEDGIAPGTRWEDVPINWTCPECGARKEDFEMVAI
jgi:rubredoxin